jgi:hypothetical protein
VMSFLTRMMSSAMSAAMLPKRPAAMRKPDISLNLLPRIERPDAACLAP